MCIAKTIQTYTIILALTLIITGAAHAATTVEVGIPGQVAAGGTINGIPEYIKYLYYFVLGLVGIAGFSSLVFWGAVWAGSGVIDKKAQAISGIKNTFSGIGIALTAFILLNTINPDLIVIRAPDIRPANIPNAPQKNVLTYNYTWKCNSKIGEGDGTPICRADGVGDACPVGCGDPPEPFPCAAWTYFCLQSNAPSATPLDRPCTGGSC